MADGIDRNSDRPAIGFPPPLVFLGFVLAGPLIERAVTIPPLATWWQIGVALILLGGLLVAVATGLFRKSGENPVPWTGTGAVIDTGIYRITRNPMYLGMAIIALGMAVVLHSWLALLLLPIAIAVIDAQVIAREEAYLERTFGTAYRAYLARVPRWL